MQGNISMEELLRPVRLNNKLYAVSNEHSLFALDLNTGQLLWEKTDPSLFITPYGLNVADGKLFYTDANSISGLDTIDGSVIWRKPVASDNILHQGYSPIVTGDTGYFRTAPVYSYIIFKPEIIYGRCLA